MDGRSQSTKRQHDTSLEAPAAKQAQLSKTDLQQLASTHPKAELTDKISKWLESIGSDSYLHASNDDLTAVPPTSGPSHASFAPLITSPDDTSASPNSGRSSVKDQGYRSRNLAANGICMRAQDEPFPEHIASVVDMARKKRDSPEPSPDDVYRDRELGDLEMKGAHESKVESYFKDRVFPKPSEKNGLGRDDKLPMSRHAVPSSAETTLRVSNPAPDMLYGYSDDAFPNQLKQLFSMGDEPVANSQLLMYPFFAIEFKGEGGSLWVATNQCLGGSASCVNIVERLNRQLKACKGSTVKPIDSTAFSIAMSGTEARLYVSWKHSDLDHSDLDYYVQKVRSFCLQEPQDYIEFRKHVKNIVDWGMDQRLKDIRESLDTLWEESRKRTSEAAKSRPPE